MRHVSALFRVLLPLSYCLRFVCSVVDAVLSCAVCMNDWPFAKTTNQTRWTLISSNVSNFAKYCTFPSTCFYSLLSFLLFPWVTPPRLSPSLCLSIFLVLSFSLSLSVLLPTSFSLHLPTIHISRINSYDRGNSTVSACNIWEHIWDVIFFFGSLKFIVIRDHIRSPAEWKKAFKTAYRRCRRRQRNICCLHNNFILFQLAPISTSDASLNIRTSDCSATKCLEFNQLAAQP